MEIITAQVLTWLSEMYSEVMVGVSSEHQYTSAPAMFTPPSEPGVNSTFSTMHARIGRIIMAMNP